MCTKSLPIAVCVLPVVKPISFTYSGKPDWLRSRSKSSRDFGLDTFEEKTGFLKALSIISKSVSTTTRLTLSGKNPSVKRIFGSV